MKTLLLVLTMVYVSPCSMAQMRETSNVRMVSFGNGGQIKMLYDARQRPQAVFLNNKLHLVFNGGGMSGDKPKAKTKSMAVTYDPLTGEFSKIVNYREGIE